MDFTASSKINQVMMYNIGVDSGGVCVSVHDGPGSHKTPFRLKRDKCWAKSMGPP
jgi:hypothetical protein